MAGADGIAASSVRTRMSVSQERPWIMTSLQDSAALESERRAEKWPGEVQPREVVVFAEADIEHAVARREAEKLQRNDSNAGLGVDDVTKVPERNAGDLGEHVEPLDRGHVGHRAHGGEGHGEHRRVMNTRSGAAASQRRIDDEALQLEQRTDLENAGHRDELPRPAYSAVVQLHLALDAGVRRERRPGELNTAFDRLVAFEIAMGVCESDLAVQAGGDGEPELRKIPAIYAKVAVQVDASSGGRVALDLGGGVEISEPVAAFDVDYLSGDRSVSSQYQRHDHNEQSAHRHLRETQLSKWCPLAAPRAGRSTRCGGTCAPGRAGRRAAPRWPRGRASRLRRRPRRNPPGRHRRTRSRPRRRGARARAADRRDGPIRRRRSSTAGARRPGAERCRRTSGPAAARPGGRG